MFLSVLTIIENGFPRYIVLVNGEVRCKCSTLDELIGVIQNFKKNMEVNDGSGNPPPPSVYDNSLEVIP